MLLPGKAMPPPSSLVSQTSTTNLSDATFVNFPHFQPIRGTKSTSIPSESIVQQKQNHQLENHVDNSGKGLENLQTLEQRHPQLDKIRDKTNEQSQYAPSSLLYRNLNVTPRHVVSSNGPWLHLADGLTLLDASGGAAVSCLGHAEHAQGAHARIVQAIVRQLGAVEYCLSQAFGAKVTEDLAEELAQGTGGIMKRAYICSSGSEAMDATMKLARQYFVECNPPEPERCHYISRRQSYHGTTIGPLSLGNYAERRNKVEPILLHENISYVSPCYPYHDMHEGESTEQYVARLADELDAEFHRVGAKQVCAFVLEPISGTGLGAVPAVPGYLAAMRSVCDRHGALLVYDEVMCGMGRSGTLHAWQYDGVAPDIQTIGKGLGGGFLPIAGVLIGAKVVNTLFGGSGAFQHGHTYQGHPVICASALEVQRILREENWVERGRQAGLVLADMLWKRIGGHRYVGDIRGRGLFWGVELVKDKVNKEPFDPKLGIADRIHERGLTNPYAISVYPCARSMGSKGDVFLISPPYNITMAVVEEIVDRTTKLIENFFDELDADEVK